MKFLKRHPIADSCNGEAFIAKPDSIFKQAGSCIIAPNSLLRGLTAGIRENVMKRLFYLLAIIPTIFTGPVWSGAGGAVGSKTAEKTMFPEQLYDAECVFDLKPVKRKAANYPELEFRRNQMGYVLLRRTISPEGHVRDIVPVDATSPNFLHSAVSAVQQWIYEVPPTKRHCLPAYNKQVRVKFSAELGENAHLNITSVKKHVDTLREKAEAGAPVAQYEYARQLDVYKTFGDKLEGVDIDYQAANDWYLKAAKAGLHSAQYQVGIDMIYGWEREADNDGGSKWIQAAALSSYPPAQLAVARELMREVSRERTLSAVEWLERGAESDHYPSILSLAWELSASRFADVRDGNRAVESLDRDAEDYFDEVRILETKAAAYAETGDFEEAVDYQEEALEEAEDLGWEIPVMQERLARYKANRPWRGRYYPSEEAKTDKQLTAANEAQATERTPSND